MFQFAIIATTIELTLCLACSILLWSRRKDTGDWSRHVLAAISFFSVLTSINKYHEYIGHPDENIYTEVLPPQHCIGGLFSLLLFFFYPVIVMAPHHFSWRRVLLLVFPWLLLLPPYLLKIPFRILQHASDIFVYATEFDVWWRLLTVCVIIGYLILLLTLPYNWRESSADSRWVRRYVCSVALMAFLFFSYQLTLWMPIHMLHQVYVGLFFVHYTYFELEVRLLPVRELGG